MKAIAYKTWLPKFDGFYETLVSFDNLFEDELYEINKVRSDGGLKDVSTWELCTDENYKRYNQDVCKLYVMKVNELINSNLDLNIKISFDSLWSPKEYNFTSDEIYCTILINKTDQKKIDKLINMSFDFLKKAIKERFTSKDGFYSNHSNDIVRWLDSTDSEYYLNCTYKVGAMFDMLLDYISENLEVESEDNDILNFTYRMYNHITEQCSFYNYCDFTGEQLESYMFIDGEFVACEGYMNAINEYNSGIAHELKFWTLTQCTPMPKQLTFDEWCLRYKIDVNTYLVKSEIS